MRLTLCVYRKLVGPTAARVGGRPMRHNAPYASTALLVPTCILLLILFLMSLATPVIAVGQQPRETPQKQTWRVIDDVPFRVVPAHPLLQETGETLQALGFDSADELLANIEKRSSFIAVAFSPDGRFLASASDDNTVKLWNVQGKALLHTFEGHSDSVSSVAFSPDGRFLASASRDRTVKLWNVEGRGELQTLLSGRGSNWITG